MIKKYLILFIDVFLRLINQVILAIGSFAECTVRLWRNNIIRRLALKLIGKTVELFQYIRNYLEYVKGSITFRILYKKTTFPMKLYYKELRRRNN